MRIALIASRPIEEIQALAAELARRGHAVRLWPLDTLRPEQFTDGALAAELSSFDLVYYRSGFTDAGRAYLGRLLAQRPERLVNPVILKHPLASNKLYQAFMAREAGVPAPPSYMGRHISFAALAAEFGAPFILKAAEGIQGRRVYLVGSEAEYQSRLGDMPGDALMQPFIPNQGDYRVFVLGGRVFEIFKRVAAPGNYKNNMSLGARGEAVSDPALRERLSALALKMAAKMDIEIGGIDIIESSPDGALYFLEANINPGWKGLDATLGTDTAAAIADYFERRAKSSATFSE